MTNVLFTFRRPVQQPDGTTVYQDNYINPYQVISCFWELRKDGKKVLSVFTLTYTFVLPEITGRNFLNHLETALRLLLNNNESVEPQQRQRRERPVMDATMVEQDLTATEWLDPAAV